MNVWQRILGNSAANMAGIGMSAILQLLSIPVLSAAWGAESYGIWLILTTIPSYFALTDFGFTQAATSDMTMNFARGDKRKVQGTFQSVVLLTAAMSVAFSVVAIGAFCLVEAFASGWMGVYRKTLFLLVFYSALILVGRILVAGLRSAGNYALGTLVYDSLVLVEGLVVLLLAYKGWGFFECALAMLFGRIANLFIIYYLLRRLTPWLYVGFECASKEEIFRLMKPALAAMAIPMSLAISLQGMVVVVGYILTPLAVAIFVPVRTASRLMIQVIGAINRATMPELSISKATENHRARKKILRLNMLLVGGVLLPGGMVFAVWGRDIVSIWSRNEIDPEGRFVALMALSMVLHGVWYFASNILMATNSHAQLSKNLLFASVFSVGASIPAAYWGALEGVAWVLVLNEGYCLLYVALRSAKKQINLVSK